MMAAVIVASGDTGMAIQYFMIALIMLFAAGLSLKWLGVGVGLGIVSIPILWNFVLQDYQITRILVLFRSVDRSGRLPAGDLWQNRDRSGQLTGQGLTHGTMTQMQLVSENQTDYIFSVAGEELGFIGCMAIICLTLDRVFLRLLPRLNHVFRPAGGGRGRHVPVPDVYEHLYEHRPAAGYGADAAVFLLRRHLGADHVCCARHCGGRAHARKALMAAITDRTAKPGFRSGNPVFVPRRAGGPFEKNTGKEVFIMERSKAWELLRQYNKEPFHLRHALTVEAVMQYFAAQRGEDADFWGVAGLLHDIDFEMWPEEHCRKAPELLRAAGADEGDHPRSVQPRLGRMLGRGAGA